MVTEKERKRTRRVERFLPIHFCALRELRYRSDILATVLAIVLGRPLLAASSVLTVGETCSEPKDERCIHGNWCSCPLCCSNLLVQCPFQWSILESVVMEELHCDAIVLAQGGSSNYEDNGVLAS